MHLSRIEWMFQFLAIGMVLVAESLNTAIEKLCDFVHPDFHKRIGFIKDISAGAATFAALIAVIIGILIYFPKLS
jgi:diacylglycerol kinase (ATP)